MVYAPVRSIIPSLKLGDYLSVQAHKPCSISHLYCIVKCRSNCPHSSIEPSKDKHNPPPPPKKKKKIKLALRDIDDLLWV